MFSGLIIYFWIPGEIEGEKQTLERFQKNPLICQKCMGSVCHLTALNTNQQSSRRKDAEVTAKITIKLGRKVVYK